jgi:hypothetical protein
VDSSYAKLGFEDLVLRWYFRRPVPKHIINDRPFQSSLSYIPHNPHLFVKLGGSRPELLPALQRQIRDQDTVRAD